MVSSHALIQVPVGSQGMRLVSTYVGQGCKLPSVGMECLDYHSLAVTTVYALYCCGTADNRFTCGDDQFAAVQDVACHSEFPCRGPLGGS